MAKEEKNFNDFDLDLINGDHQDVETLDDRAYYQHYDRYLHDYDDDYVDGRDDKYIKNLNELPYYNLYINDEQSINIKKEMKMSCVAFIDILGFTDMVHKNIDKVILALRYIKLCRDSFCRMPTIGAQTGNYNSGRPKATMFSDSIIISHEIDEDFNLHAYIVFLAEVQAILLRNGIIIRGGVEIGELYHDESFIFGEGLIEAYELENKKAIYPRILIGQKLLDQIEEQEKERFDNHYNYYGNYDKYKYEDPKQKYISTDFDNKKFINYMKYALYQLDPYSIRGDNSWAGHIKRSESLYKSEIKPISDFIISGLKIKDERIFEKYKWLKDLYNRTLDIYIWRAINEEGAKLFTEIWENRHIV